MRVLVACEKSGIVRDAFLEAGHDAMSCDLEPTDSPGPHHQGDVRPLLRWRWDLVIAHPPCTKLTRARGRRASWEEIGDAIDFFVECYRANAPAVAVENPVPFACVSRFLGPPQDRVDPWMFGDGYRKRTWFWTRGLPPLLAEMQHASPGYWLPSNKSKENGDGPRNSSARSRFWPGMARAMAQQWGSL